MPTRLFWSGANKKSFKSKNSVGRKCCQLKVLKVLLMHLFVTLLINKTTGSDNQHFFFNTLKNENKEEFLTYGKLTNATVIGLSETKLNNTVLSSELKTEGYDLVRSYRSRRGGGVACFVKNSISYNRKPNFCINTESIFIEIFLPKSKPVLIGILYRPPDKYDFVNCLERTFSDTNVFESQECYLLGDININLQPKDKEIFRHKYAKDY